MRTCSGVPKRITCSTVRIAQLMKRLGTNYHTIKRVIISIVIQNTSRKRTATLRVAIYILISVIKKLHTDVYLRRKEVPLWMGNSCSVNILSIGLLRIL